MTRSSASRRDRFEAARHDAKMDDPLPKAENGSTTSELECIGSEGAKAPKDDVEKSSTSRRVESESKKDGNLREALLRKHSTGLSGGEAVRSCRSRSQAPKGTTGARTRQMRVEKTNGMYADHDS